MKLAYVDQWIWIGICLLAAINMQTLAADAPVRAPLEVFSYRATINPGPDADGTPVRFTIPPEAYRGLTRADLGDLRVFNADGSSLPYSLTSPPAVTAASVPIDLKWFPMPTSTTDGTSQRVDIQVQDPGVRVDVSGSNNALATQAYIVDMSNALAAPGHPPLDNLVLSWDPATSGFSDFVSVQGSDDLSNWHSVSGARLVQLDYLDQHLKQDRLDLYDARAHYLKLTWEPGHTPPHLTRVQVVPGTALLATNGEAYFLLPDPVATSAGDYAYDAGAPMSADQVQLTPLPDGVLIEANILVRDDPAKPWQSVAAGTFYNLRQNSVRTSNPPINLPAHVRARYWLLRTDARSSSLGDGKPGFEIMWKPQQVVFLAQPPGPYTLAFGNPDVTDASLPLSALLPGYATDPYGVLRRIVESNPAPATKFQPVAFRPASVKATWQLWLAWSSIGGAVLVLALMAWRLVKQMEKA